MILKYPYLILKNINDVHFFTYTKNIDELEHEQAAHIYRTDEYISKNGI